MNRSQTQLIGIILLIVVFIIVIYIFFELYNASNFGGSMTCKTGYALASLATPLVNSFQTVGNTLTTLSSIILITTIAFSAAAAAHDSVDDLTDSLDSQIVGKSTPLYETGPDGFSKVPSNLRLKIQFSNLNDVSSLSKDSDSFIKSFAQNLYRARYILIGAGGGLALGLSLSALSNSIAQSFQGPILNSLCPVENIYINSSEISKKFVSTYFYTRYYKNFAFEDNNNQQAIFTSEAIAYFVFQAFGDTLGASVSLANPRVQYIILLDYKSNVPITYKSIVCSLYAMHYNNINLYNAMYNGVPQQSYNYGIGNDQICNDLGINENKLISSNGKTLIAAELYDIQNNQGYEGYITNGPGIYAIYIIYDGVGDILISSIKYQSNP